MNPFPIQHALDQFSMIELSVIVEMLYNFAISNMLSTSQMLLLSSYNVANATEELNS